MWLTTFAEHYIENNHFFSGKNVYFIFHSQKDNLMDFLEILDDKKTIVKSEDITSTKEISYRHRTSTEPLEYNYRLVKIENLT